LRRRDALPARPAARKAEGVVRVASLIAAMGYLFGKMTMRRFLLVLAVLVALLVTVGVACGRS
jgi:phage-related holin